MDDTSTPDETVGTQGIPVFQMARGNPTDEEIAAAVTVLSLALAPRPNPRPAADRPVAGGWNSYVRTVRHEHRPGRGAWTARF